MFVHPNPPSVDTIPQLIETMSEFHRRWRPSPALFFTLEDTEIATIPIEFMRSAKVDNWDYIRYVLRACVDIKGDFKLFRDEIEIVSNSPVVPGDYTIMRSDTLTKWTFCKGPQGKSPSRARNTLPDETSDSTSQSSRSSTSQAQHDF